mgnify:CR=1 FL=1
MRNFFGFNIGDVIQYDGHQYFVIENNGLYGTVNPFGEDYYIRNFRWDFNGKKTTFVRKATEREIINLGLEEIV